MHETVCLEVQSLDLLFSRLCTEARVLFVIVGQLSPYLNLDYLMGSR